MENQENQKENQDGLQDGLREKSGLATKLKTALFSIRFRIAAIYSLTLFLVSSAVILVIYLVVRRGIRGPTTAEQLNNPSNRDALADLRSPLGDGLELDVFIDQAQNLERQENQQLLNDIESYSVLAVLVIFVASLIIGWIIAGRALKPIGQITRVAQDIQAADLSRRINMNGPEDELKELSDTFDGMLNRLDDALESRRSFMQDASHELRNPIQTMRTNLEITMSDSEADLEDYRRTAEVVNKSIDRVAKVVEDLTTFTRYETPSAESALIDVGRLVKDTKEEFLLMGESKNIRLEAEYSPGIEIAGDVNALKRAFANLVTNAMEAMESSPPKESPLVGLSCGKDEGWAWIRVKDNGPGIQPKDKERIFQRFQRGGGNFGQGRGLGLAIVSQVAETHGGKVALESEPGKGATFTMRIPLAG